MTPSGGQTVQLAEGLLKAMSAASRTLRLYPETSPLPLQAVRNFHGLLSQALAEKPFISIGVVREGFTFQGERFAEGHEGLKAFATDLFARQVSAFIFRVGVNEREILEFLRILALDPMIIREQGGLTAMLLEHQVTNLVVDEIELHVVDEETVGGATGEMVMTLVDDVSQSAVKAVEHFFVSLSSSVPEMVEWLRSVSPPPTGPGQSTADDLFGAVRQLGTSITATTELPQEQAPYLRNIAEGVLALDEPLRSEVVCERMIPAAAASPLFAKILSQFSESELASLLASAGETGMGTVQKLLGDLSILGDRQEQVYSLLEQMLFEKGHSQEEMAELKVALTGQAAQRTAQGVSEEVVEVLLAVSEYSDEDLRCIGSSSDTCDDDATCASGVRIQLALLALAEDEAEYGATLECLPELLARLVEYGNVEVAADSLDWASAHARSVMKMWPTAGERLKQLVAQSGRREVMECLVEFLRRHTAERDVRAVTRYVSLLSDSSIEYLIDALAEENVVANRKRLCAVLSETGRKAVHVLGSKLGDPRWFLVRNVVSVLGMMRDSAALPYLERSLAHPDARVRAEAVRAVGMIRDPSAASWLIQRLYDPDHGIKVAAARWLGRMRATEAVSALCQLADNRVRGDIEVVKAAIQALGQIGDESARPALERVASRRAILRRSRVRELRALAVDALKTLSESEDGGST